MMNLLKPFTSFAVMLLALTFHISSAGALTLAELQQQFSQKEIVRAHFVQQRYISGMALPLKSSGQMLMSSDHGLWWQQQKPFPMTLVLTDEKMIQTVDRQPPEIITAESDPQLFQFNSLLQALFQADQTVLEQNFDLDLKVLDGGLWQLHLIPNSSPLDKIFSSITLTGDADLQSIEMLDGQGDKTLIQFTTQPLNDQNRSLSAEEQAYFSH